MRVCQFRHYGTLESVGLRDCLANHLNREPLVCQRQPLLSIQAQVPYTWSRSVQHITIPKAGPTMTDSTDPTHPVTPANATKAATRSPGTSDTLATENIPEDLAIEVRRLAHDLSNALEIIVQTSYLLSTVELKEPASDWLRMLDSGVSKALDINLALRNYIKSHTAT